MDQPNYRKERLEKREVACDIIDFWSAVDFMKQDLFPKQIEEKNIIVHDIPLKSEVRELLVKDQEFYEDRPYYDRTLQWFAGKIEGKVLLTRFYQCFGFPVNEEEEVRETFLIKLETDREGRYMEGSLRLSPALWVTYQCMESNRLDKEKLTKEQYFHDMCRMNSMISGGEQVQSGVLQRLYLEVFDTFLKPMQVDSNLLKLEGNLVYRRYETKEEAGSIPALSYQNELELLRNTLQEEPPESERFDDLIDYIVGHLGYLDSEIIPVRKIISVQEVQYRLQKDSEKEPDICLAEALPELDKSVLLSDIIISSTIEWAMQFSRPDHPDYLHPVVKILCCNQTFKNAAERIVKEAVPKQFIDMRDMDIDALANPYVISGQEPSDYQESYENAKQAFESHCFLLDSINSEKKLIYYTIAEYREIQAGSKNQIGASQMVIDEFMEKIYFYTDAVLAGEEKKQIALDKLKAMGEKEDRLASALKKMEVRLEELEQRKKSVLETQREQENNRKWYDNLLGKWMTTEHMKKIEELNHEEEQLGDSVQRSIQEQKLQKESFDAFLQEKEAVEQVVDAIDCELLEANDHICKCQDCIDLEQEKINQWETELRDRREALQAVLSSCNYVSVTIDEAFWTVLEDSQEEMQLEMKSEEEQAQEMLFSLALKLHTEYTRFYKRQGLVLMDKTDEVSPQGLLGSLWKSKKVLVL